MRAPGVTTYHVYPTDCDVFGHVNHATMITLLEHARWALLEPVARYEGVPCFDKPVAIHLLVRTLAALGEERRSAA